MNVQRSLVHEFTLYEFERGYKTVEATINIFVWKVKVQLITEQ